MADISKEELFILKGLLRHLDFVSRFADKLKADYFSNDVAPVVVCIRNYFLKHAKIPTPEMITDHFLDKVCRGNEDLKQAATTVIEDALAIPFEKGEYSEHYEWLISKTKDWIISKSVENALMDAADLYRKGNPQKAVSRILEASHINFDDDIGLDYYEDVDKRIEQLKEKTQITPTGIENFDRAIGGGLRPKSLVVIGAGTNVGKTLILGGLAANLIQQGKNVLYITLEINDFLLSNRIDANIANIKLNELSANADRLKEIISSKYANAEAMGKPFGRLIVKEYPPATISAHNILSAIREFEIKRGGFKPDFICVDYLGLMIPNASAFSDNTYGKLKTVSEELRAIGSKLGITILSAVQINREGIKQEKPGMEHTSDSLGIPQTADVMVIVTRPDDENLKHVMYWDIAKSRWSKNGEKIEVGVDYDYMKLYSIDMFSREEHETEKARAVIAEIGSENADNTTKKEPLRGVFKINPDQNIKC